MIKYYSYVMPRDYGFAPNPFGSDCTLATCKPRIRKAAKIDDWIFGTTSVANQLTPKIAYAMKITEKISFNDYYSSADYQYKKPVMNGSLKKMYGDNIYHQKSINGEINWFQDDSHHSYENGNINYLNLRNDTSISDSVLISKKFYYFGNFALPIPVEIINEFCKSGPGHRHIETDIALKMIGLIENTFEIGYHGDPALFEDSFERYDGK